MRPLDRHPAGSAAGWIDRRMRPAETACRVTKAT
jgi:hypothetical protein